MQFSNILPALTLIAAALAENIVVRHEKYQEGDKSVTYDNATVFHLANWSIIDTNQLNVKGGFLNNGVVYFGSDSQKEIKFNVEGEDYDFFNNGDLIITSDSSKTPEMTIKAGHLENRGNIFLEGTGEISSLDAYISPKEFFNKGQIHFYQDEPSETYLYLGYQDNTVYNDGLVCLKNSAYKRRAPVSGEDGQGCFDIGDNSTIWHTSVDKPFSNQTHIFSGTGGVLVVSFQKTAQPYVVRNWGSGNTLSTSTQLSELKYSGGVLTAIADKPYNVNFDIGEGYDASKFKIVVAKYPGYSVEKGGIAYDGPAPNSDRPEVCPPCKAVPAQPPHVA